MSSQSATAAAAKKPIQKGQLPSAREHNIYNYYAIYKRKKNK